MPVFAYEGRTASGEVRKGNIEATSKKAAMDRLRQMQIEPSTVKAKGGLGEFNIPTPDFMKPKVTNKDLVIFTRQFATMIDSGLPLVQCLDIQGKQAPNPSFREKLLKIKESVESGSTFADALKRHPDVFDSLYQSLVAAGEVGGILDTILNRLAAYLEKSDKLKRKVKGAMSYPVIVIIAAVIIVSILLLKVVPTFEDMFAEFGASLPGPTQFVVDLSKKLKTYFFPLIGLGIVVYFAFKRIYKTEKGHYFIDKILLKLPVFGELLTKVAVARFCRTLGTMVSSGVPILEALDICARTAGNKVIEGAVYNVRDSISEGRTIAEPLAESGVFPDMVCQMIHVGEATGALDVMLNKIADFYDDEVDQAVENLTAMIEPMIMAGLGIVIGGLVIAMYMPIFEMAGNIGG